MAKAKKRSKKKPAKKRAHTRHIHIHLHEAAVTLGKKGGAETAKERKAGTLGKKGRGRRVVRASYGV